RVGVRGALGHARRGARPRRRSLRRDLRVRALGGDPAHASRVQDARGPPVRGEEGPRARGRPLEAVPRARPRPGRRSTVPAPVRRARGGDSSCSVENRRATVVRTIVVDIFRGPSLHSVRSVRDDSSRGAHSNFLSAGRVRGAVPSGGCMPGRRSRTEEVLVLRKTAVAIIPSVAAVLVMLGGPARGPRTPNTGPRAARPAPRIEALREMMRESGRGDDRYREGRGYRDAFQAWFFSQRAYPGETVPRN